MFGKLIAHDALRAAIDTGALQRCSAPARLVYTVLVARHPEEAVYVEEPLGQLAKLCGFRGSRAVDQLKGSLAELGDANLVTTIQPIGKPWQIHLVAKVEDIDPIRFDPWRFLRGDEQAEAEVAELTAAYKATGDGHEQAEAKAVRQVARRYAELNGERNLFGA